MELEEGWVLTPRFGDTQGMVFSRQGSRRGPKIALFMVRVEEASGAISTWMRALEEGLRGQPGFKRLSERQTQIAGQPGLIRDYKTQVSSTVEKRIRWYVFAVRSRFYLLHAETERRHMRRIMPEIKRMVRSFKAKGGRSRTEPMEPAESAIPSGALVGAWIADSGLVLDLRAGGRFSLADVSGRYELNADTLTLLIPNRAAQKFRYQVDLVRGTLVLSAPGLAEPIRYRRKAAGGSGSPKVSAGAAALLGRWKAGGVQLSLLRDRTFKMGSNFSGRWKAQGGRLELIRSASERLTYKYKLSGKRLTLSGADLDQPLVFTRVGDPR